MAITDTHRNVPILMTIFNRPKKTHRVIDALRAIKPRQVFVAADGPRTDHPSDMEKCHQARETLACIDWSCDLKTFFRDNNVGCDSAVSTAIHWFFEQVPHGVILEDDCIPHPDFFHFCSDIFERFADDHRIMQVSGFAPYTSRLNVHDYHFSRSFRCGGGWGTWRRAWNLYTDSVDIYDGDIESILKAYYPYSQQYSNQTKLYEKFRCRNRDNWDFKWNLACYANNGLCVVPEKNLIKNIGFDEESTHTKNVKSCFANINSEPLRFPLHHPAFIFADDQPEQDLKKICYHNLNYKSRCAWHLRHALGTWKDFFNTLP